MWGNQLGGQEEAGGFAIEGPCRSAHRHYKAFISTSELDCCVSDAE